MLPGQWISVLVTVALGTGVGTKTVHADASISATADTTCLMQMHATFRTGSHRRENSCSESVLISKFGNDAVTRLLETVLKHSSWDGDWNFMTETECARREENRKCIGVSAEADCRGNCQWYPLQKVCKTLKVDPLLDYAQAGPSSPFSLYANAIKRCSGRSRQECSGECAVKENSFWAPCDVSLDAHAEILCKDSFQSLLSRMQDCDAASDARACEDTGCSYDEESRKCKVAPGEWYTMGFGEDEGKLLEGRSKKATMTCRNDKWGEACQKSTELTSICNRRGTFNCTGQCSPLGSGGVCDIAESVYDGICEKVN